MNPEIKVIWLEALRSGLYKQGKSLLKVETREGELEYCCLGVLCELAVKAGVISDAERDVVFNYEGGRPFTFADLSRAALPPEVAEWSGVDGAFGNLPSLHGVYSDLAGLNDAGKPFDLIADVIEEQL